MWSRIKVPRPNKAAGSKKNNDPLDNNDRASMIVNNQENDIEKCIIICDADNDNDNININNNIDENQNTITKMTSRYTLSHLIRELDKAFNDDER